MNRDRLRAILPASLHGQIDELATAYEATGLPLDPAEFIAWLHDTGHLDPVGLRDALASTDVSVTLSEPGPDETQIATPDGTLRHRYLGLLGKGAMGEVHIARDQALGRNVAIKKMIPRFARHRVGNARFQTEVQITAQLDHPSIVPVYSLETSDDGLPAYSMKLVRGRTLTEYLTETRAFYERGARPDTAHALPARLDVFLHICNAMAYAHSRGVIHRDLKPDNVMIGAFHEVIVMDWGIAKVVSTGELPSDAELDEGVKHPAVTTIGAAVGTPTYMSPEQAQGKNPELGPASDQFALGLLLFEVVSLRRAYTGNTGQAVLVRAAHARKEPLVHLSPKEPIPRELAGIIAKATAYEPAQRYASVDAFAEDIRRYLRDVEVQAAPDRGLQRLSRWVSHHREVTLTVGFGLVLAIVVGAFTGLIAMDFIAEHQRRQVELHEERIQRVVSHAAARSHRIDTAFQGFQSLVEGLAGASRIRLTEAASPAPYWVPGDIIAGKGPADLAPAPYYHTERASLLAPDVVVSADVPTDAVAGRIHQAVGLRDEMWGVMRGSVPDHARLTDDAIAAQVRSTGVPAMWAYVALADGVLVGLPGVWRYPPDYDVRAADWFVEGMRYPDAHWFSASLDESGQGLLITCTRRIDAPDGTPLGLAALDVGMEHILAHYLTTEDLPPSAVIYLVDEQGRIMAQSTLKVFQEEPKAFPYPELLAQVRSSGGIGHMEGFGPEGADLAAWSTLEGMGWTLLIIGPEADLLSE